MDSLNIAISNIRSIKSANLEIPFEGGIYTFVGSNGSGKSTLMRCLATLIRMKSIEFWGINASSQIQTELNGQKRIWRSKDGGLISDTSVGYYYGLYEGSLFYGTRFEDSGKIDVMLSNGRISPTLIIDADEYVKDHVSYILHGDYTHYRNLKRIKNKAEARKIKIRNLPYFMDYEGTLISQYRMSSGECLLISLIHFFYNAIERRNLSVEQKAVVIIDELELALHPVAILRLVNFLKEVVKDRPNLVIYLSSHSPEVIRTIPPRNLFKVNINSSGILTMERNCYPSYLIRDLYSNVSPDFLLLVEDQLAQLVVNKILTNKSLRINRLIHCVPVGGWQNVLDLYEELYTKKVLGTSTKIINILDGDAYGKLIRKQKSYPHCFLPVQSVEKFLYAVLKEEKNPSLRKIISDKYFIVDSLDQIISDYNEGTRKGFADNNKNFYDFILKRITSAGTTEETFINGLCDDIINTVDMTKFIINITNLLQ
ncbi:MAG: ATP-binding protein [Muribaculaceae bacterium]|nr:ATP-binding protein [Muribaculaceae bacterium]